MGIPVAGYIPKPLARQLMIVDDILADARNSLVEEDS